MEGVHEVVIGVGEVVSLACSYIVGVEVLLVVSSDNKHMVSWSSVGIVRVIENFSRKRSNNRMSLCEFVFEVLDSRIIYYSCFS